MELARDITLILHFIGLALIIGPFIRPDASSLGLLLWLGADRSNIQLVTGLLLTGLAEMRLADDPDMAVDHIKIAVKTSLP
jgi:hypothetical protein